MTVAITPQPSISPTPATTLEESKLTHSAPKGEAFVLGIKIVPVEMKERSARLGYELEVSCPQIDAPRTPREREFNSYVSKMIGSYVKEFKAFCAKNKKYPDGTKRSGEYHLATKYEVLYATPELLSIDLMMESFTGYLNSDWSPIPVNYNLKAGKPIRNLADLFQPGSQYLDSIAAYCVDELMRRGLNCGGGGVADERWLRRGAEPKAENYSGWNLTRDGVQVNFGEYQVGPGCVGLVSVVVPYEHLKGMLRKGVGWRRPASA